MWSYNDHIHPEVDIYLDCLTRDPVNKDFGWNYFRLNVTITRMFTHRISVTTTVFFILIGLFVRSNQVLAKENQIKFTFDKSTASAKKDTTFEANVVFNGSSKEKISAASILLKYSPSLFEYSESASTDPNEACKKLNPGLNQILGVKNDSGKGILKITRVRIDKNEQLPSGRFCFGTVRLKAKGNFWMMLLPWIAQTGTISFTDLQSWEIVGPDSSFKPSSETANQAVKVSIK